jgi:hypothetical protein
LKLAETIRAFVGKDAAKFDHVAFGAVQDELEYAYAVKTDKEMKRAARAKRKAAKLSMPLSLRYF